MKPLSTNLYRLTPLLLLATAASARQVSQEPFPSAPASAPESVQPRLELERVHFDRPGDGDLWVRGADYKARFGRDAVEFVPFLGSEAPRNFPVTFELAEVRVGETQLDLARAVEPVHHAAGTNGDVDVVSYDRGDVVEHYVVELGSIEQRFRLDRAPAGSGDLVIRVDVESELACAEDAEGFCFAGELGGVRYGRAVTFDAMGALTASPTRQVDGGLEIRVPADFLATAEYPLTVDPVVSGFAVDDTFVIANPDIAFDVTNQTYCIVAEFAFSANDYDIFSQFYSSNGVLGLGTGIWVDLTTDDWKRPQIASNNAADQFLVVAVEGGFSGQIAGRTRAATPNSMGPQFQVNGTNELGSKSNPDVGGDPSPVGPSYFCVVWQNTWNDDGDIHARRVSVTGQPFGSTFVIDGGIGDDARPRISKSCGMPPRASQRWNVAWMRYQSTSNYDVYGAQVSWEGQITAPPFQIDTTGTNDRYPSPSSLLDGSVSERPYMVAWIDGSDIIGKVLRGGVLLTPRTNLTALEGGANLGYQQLSPCVESDGSSFVMAYSEARPSTGYDIRVAEYDYAAGEIVCTDANRPVAGSAEMEINPYLTSRRSGGDTWNNFAAVWNDIGGPNGTAAEGALFYSTGFGHIYCASNPNSVGDTGTVRLSGSRSVSHQTMSLWAQNCPPNKPGIFFLGSVQVDQPFGEGRRCVGGAVKRLPVSPTNSAGVAYRPLDFSAPYASGIVASGVNYQYWYRDPSGGPEGFNTTSALHAEHTP